MWTMIYMNVETLTSSLVETRLSLSYFFSDDPA